MGVERQSYFPLFWNMSGKTILFVGGGRVAERRIMALLSVVKKGLHIIVVSPEATALVDKYATDGYIYWKRREFSPEDVDNADFVIAASDRRDMNERIVGICQEKGIPVNDAGKKENCDFYFPGIAVKGSVVAGITASGKDHNLTRDVTKAIRELLDREVRETE
ncbi:bifunctional precorrin-2 dehydrogenase/sirohydrochlorin ferrochelatase [Lachnospiraceae bacterium 62-35]